MLSRSYVERLIETCLVTSVIVFSHVKCLAFTSSSSHSFSIVQSQKANVQSHTLRLNAQYYKHMNSNTDNDYEYSSLYDIKESDQSAAHNDHMRRVFLQMMLSTVPFIADTSISNAVESSENTPTSNKNQMNKQSQSEEFISSGFSRQEYTNSITASRDTNISPKEAYETISTAYISKQPIKDALNENRIPKALDLGAGAGVSTQLLYEMGYKDIDAVDWSGDAWRTFVGENNEELGGVRFWEMDDERFRDLWRKGRTASFKEKAPNKEKYDAVVYNFAVNDAKAKSMASEMLTETGKLLAPVNAQDDYWLKQSYRVYDKSGKMLWQTGEVGAWSVQFQPDVTQDTCQGIWCPPFNGFQKKR